MTIEELRERQSWSLSQKMDHSLGVIEQFYQRLNGMVYISFSGGKDSTILYWLARRIYPDIKAVFCNTGNEYPEIVKFVRDMKNNIGGGYNIDIIYPSKKPKDIFSEFGFPLVSKETSAMLYNVRHKPYTKKAQRALDTDTSNFTRIANKYRYLIDEPYDCSNLCCMYLKEKPLHEYALTNGLSPILGTMACESPTREFAYITASSCNTFNNRDKRKQKSRPLSIWLEKDVYECIDKYKIPICPIYEKGLDRTGCSFCGFGVQFKQDNRLSFLYDNHRKLYDTFMSYTNNGVTYKDAIRKVLAVNNLLLPDEKPITLF